MKYYADEETRKQWLIDFPDYEMPPHEDPPFDRDRNLPKRDFRQKFQETMTMRDSMKLRKTR